MKRLAARFFLIVALALGSVMVAPPAEAQRGEQIPIERVDRDLREALVRAMRRAGVEIGGEISVIVSRNDCPSNCNNNTLGGKCYCAAGDDGCPEGTDEVRGGSGNRACSVNPTTAAFTSGGMREPMQFLLD